MGRNRGKTNPLNDNDLKEFVQLQKNVFHDNKSGEAEKSWSLAISDIDQTTYDLSVKNPNQNDEVILRSTQEVLAEIKI